MKNTDMHTKQTGWWDDFCVKVSPSLWLPTTQLLRNMPQSDEGFVYPHLLRNTWFGSEVYSLAGRTDREASEALTEGRAMRSRKIRIYPGAEQRRILSGWLDAARYIHNKTLEYIAGGNPPEWQEAKRSVLGTLPEWTLGVPGQIKAGAVRDACISYRDSQDGSKFSFKARGNAKQSIFIPKASVNSKGIYTKYLGGMEYSEDIPAPEGNCRLTREHGRWFVSIPVKAGLCGTSGNNTRLVSLDPGIRTFITFYSPDSCGKIGKGAFSRIYSLCRYLDSLNAGMQETGHRQRYRMKKAAERLYSRTAGLVEELQHRAALFLVKNFDVILLPEYRQDFADGINSRSFRDIAALAHRGFQDFIRSKAQEYGRKVIAQNEEGTSGVCSWNGEAVRAGRYIRNGSITVDRDYNGARGIFLRALRESAVPVSIVRPDSGRDALPEGFRLKGSGNKLNV